MRMHALLLSSVPIDYLVYARRAEMSAWIVCGQRSLWVVVLIGSGVLLAKVGDAYIVAVIDGVSSSAKMNSTKMKLKNKKYVAVSIKNAFFNQCFKRPPRLRLPFIIQCHILRERDWWVSDWISFFYI